MHLGARQYSLRRLPSARPGGLVASRPSDLVENTDRDEFRSGRKMSILRTFLHSIMMMLVHFRLQRGEIKRLE